MTMPDLPPNGNTNWRGWASAIHDAATEVTEGRLSDAALGAAFVLKLPGFVQSAVVPDVAGDQAAILQAEIDTLATAGGGAIFLPRGVIAISSIRLRHRVHLHGAGRQTTVLEQSFTSTEPGAVTIDSGPVFANLHDLEVRGTGIAGKHGIYARAIGTGGSPDHGGWWWSSLERVIVRGFDGDQIWLRGGGADSLKPHQFLTFRDVEAYTDNERAALRLTGQVGQMSFIGNCIFDGVTGAAGTNIVVTGEVNDDLTEFSPKAPYALRFDGVTCQSNDRGLFASRVVGLNWRGGYMEGLGQGIEVHDQSWSVTVADSIFANVGVATGGAGFVIKSRNGSRVYAAGNLIGGATPDADVVAVDGGTVTTADNVLDSARSIETSGLTVGLNVEAGGVVNFGSAATALVNSSATPIDTIVSSRGPGEMLHFRAWEGPLSLASGGNIGLLRTSPVTVPWGALVTLVRLDQGNAGDDWVLHSIYPTS